MTPGPSTASVSHTTTLGVQQNSEPSSPGDRHVAFSDKHALTVRENAELYHRYVVICPVHVAVCRINSVRTQNVANIASWRSWIHRLLCVRRSGTVSVPRQGVDDHGYINDDAGICMYIFYWYMYLHDTQFQVPNEHYLTCRVASHDAPPPHYQMPTSPTVRQRHVDDVLSTAWQLASTDVKKSPKVKVMKPHKA